MQIAFPSGDFRDQNLAQQIHPRAIAAILCIGPGACPLSQSPAHEEVDRSDLLLIQP